MRSDGPSCHVNIRALRVDRIKALLETNQFNVLHTIALRRPLPSVASLLYNNHHAGCLFPFRFGAGIVIDPLDSGAKLRPRSSVVAAGVVELPLLVRYAKKRIGHAFPGASSAAAAARSDKRLYSIPLKSSPLQSQNSECCMWISIGILLAYRWCTKGSTRASVGSLQRLVSFLRRKGRISDALLRYAIQETHPHLRRP